MLPLSSNMSAAFFFTDALLTFPTSATAAGDGQVRVFDLLRSARTTTRGYGDTKVSPLLISRCHSGHAKRIAIEDSPSQFLSVGEVLYITFYAPDMIHLFAKDGTVRQHDMRVSHQCKTGCPAPLAKLPHPLSTLSNSPLACHLFVVAGLSPHVRSGLEVLTRG